jgi:hypothetical protein
MSKSKQFFSLGAALQVGLLGVIILLGLNYETLLNQYALATYHPTAQVTGFESRIGLTTPARAVLYRANPKFDQKAAFNTDCDTKPHELELGCYYHGRIYVLVIQNASLAQEMDVVSAHELLHVVWAQMSPRERASLTPELEQAYRGLNDKDLNERVAGYAQSEPGEEANELHSILGTEFSGLSPVLEAHYAKYFSNRTQITAAHAAYQSVFDTRRTELERELASIRARKANLSNINRQLEAYKASGQVQVYNALVPEQNRLVDAINKQIEAYRVGVEEYNELSKSLDSQQITDTETAAQ